MHKRIAPVAQLLMGGLLVSLANTASGADPKGQYGVRGAALVPCAIYERERAAESEVYRMIASWMDGYITAINQYVPGTYDAAAFESTELLAALVNESCKKNPDTSVFVVVNALVELFATNRLQVKSDKVEVAVGDLSVMIYKAIIKRINERLELAGHYQGEINDRYSTASEDAMRAYQESIGFEPTGFPDQLTLYRLFYDDRE